MRMGKCYVMLLFVILVCAVLSACTPGDGPEDDQQGAKEGFREMNGQEFIFRGSFINPDPRDYTDEEAAEAARAEVETVSLEQEAMMEACAVVEENTNCRIVRKQFDEGFTSSSFAAAYAAGQSPTDFFYGEIRFARELYVSGYIQPITDIEAIDNTDYEKWGNAEKQMATSYKGTLFGLPCVGSNYYPYPYYYYGILVCKNDVYESFGLDTTPQEMIENKKWTFSNFADLLPNLYDDSGTENDKVWAFAHSGLPMCAVYANGGNKVVKEKGEYVFGYTQPAALRALEWAKSIYGLTDCAKESDEKALSDFYDGKIVFLMTNGYRMFGDITYNTSNFSWLPFPYGPDVEYGSTCASYTTAQDGIISIMKGQDAQKVQDTGYIVNLLFDATPHFGKDGYQNYLYRSFFDSGDESSFEVYLDMGRNMHYDYSLELGSVNDEIISRISAAMKSSGSVSNVMESVKDAVNDKLDEELND